jgi:hypothetical protein
MLLLSIDGFAMIDFVKRFVASKRNVVFLIAVAPIVWQICLHIKAGEPVPESLIQAFMTACGVWTVSDSIRPTMPKV